MASYTEILHPIDTQSLLNDLQAKVSALETSDQKYALRGGSAINYDTTGRIASLNVAYLNGQVIDAQVANIDWAKITNVSVTNAQISSLDAGKITSGNIASTRMQTNVLAALQASVSSLSAISADIGTITAGSITGITITGGTIRTSSGTRRVELNGADNELQFYYGNVLTGSLYGDSGGIALWGDSGNIVISAAELLYMTAPENIEFVAVGSNFLVDANNIDITSGGLTVAGWGSFSGDLDMNNYILKEVKAIEFQEQSTRPSDNDMIYYRNASGSYSFRSRMEGSNWQFDQSSV